MKRFSFLLRLLTAIAGVLILAGPAFASATAGVIRGLVVDDGGLAIPGALVTLASPAMIGGAQQRTTDGDGRFAFVELPPGAYNITAQKQGFATVKKTGVEVAIGRTTELTMELQYGGKEVVVVAKSSVIDTEDTSKGQVFNQDFLSRIPTGRSYQDVVGNTAGVTGGEFSGGASYDENTYTLDGVNVTDPVTGTFSMNFNFDALQEVQVVTNDFDPEFGESLGARISLVTRSGSNTLETTVNAQYQNGNWGPKADARYASDGFQLSPTGFDSSFQSFDAAVTVSGPIVKDKVWVIGSYQFNRYLASNAGILLPRDFDGHYFFSKLTVQPTAEHRLALSFLTDPTTIDNEDQSDRYTLPEAQSRQVQGNYQSSLKWNWFINPDANFEAYASFQKQYLESGAVACTHDENLGYNPCEAYEPEGWIDYTTPARYGFNGAYNSGNAGSYSFDDRTTGQFYAKLNVLQIEGWGTHDIKVGMSSRLMDWEWLAATTGNLYFYDYLANPADPDTRANYYWVESSDPFQFNASAYHIAGHISDTYKPVENLTILYGTRVDHGKLYNDVGATILDITALGPRVSASWDPFGTEKTQIRAGYGRFNDAARMDVAYYLGVSGSGYKAFYGGVLDNNYGVPAASLADIDIESTITLWDEQTSPHTDLFELGGSREVVPDLAVGVDFTAKFTRNIYTFDETNLIYDSDGYTYIGSSYGNVDNYFRLRSPTIARRDYYETDIYLKKPFTKRWLANFTYSYVVSKGTTQYASTTNLSNPSQVDLGYGNLYTDIHHQIKAQAAWDIPNDPWTTQIGFSGQFFSGSPFSRYYYSPAGSELGQDGYNILKEPLGTYAREAPWGTLDILVQQKFPVSKGTLAAKAEVNNILNGQQPTYTYTAYVDYYNRYIVGYLQSPIQGKVSVEYEF